MRGSRRRRGRRKSRRGDKRMRRSYRKGRRKSRGRMGRKNSREIWHRRKLPFEIPNFAKFCHKKKRKICHILP